MYFYDLRDFIKRERKKKVGVWIEVGRKSLKRVNKVWWRSGAIDLDWIITFFSIHIHDFRVVKVDKLAHMIIFTSGTQFGK